MIRLGVDTGGTFTDFVVWREGTLTVHKVPSTPQAPDHAIWRGIVELGIDRAVQQGEVVVVHGTTVATNAALEGKGVKTVFVTNRGFADLLSLGRQARPDLYQLRPLAQHPPTDLCLEVNTRRGADGGLIAPLTETECRRLCQEILSLEPEAVAICLLFSYLNPAEEIAIANSLAPTMFVSRSSAVLPEYKEYERGIATWLNAYLGPVMQRYLNDLSQGLRPSQLSVMQSSGGTISAEVASDNAVNLLLSGPAGGLAAVKFLSDTAGLGGLMTFDMGGTSTDVALVVGDLSFTNESHIGPYPVAVPSVDMHTIGAGGGSLASIDAGGLLQVGPQSAGADPGPACYGRGGKQATVTDANVVVGHLPAGNKLGGTLALDSQAAYQAIAILAEQLRLSVADTAAGIINIANEHMARALRVISVQRGHDPKDFRLCSFGGAGGLHVCDLAERLGMSKAVVPVHAGVLSALGLLTAPRERQLARSVQQELENCAPLIQSTLSVLRQEGIQQLVTEGAEIDAIQSQASVDLRYCGQSAYLNLPFHNLAQCQADFHALHAQRYGHRLDIAVELVNIRQRVYALPEKLTLPKQDNSANPLAESSSRFPLYQRSQLPAGWRLQGPALICEDTATTLVSDGWRLEVDDYGNLLLEKEE